MQEADDIDSDVEFVAIKVKSRIAEVVGAHNPTAKVCQQVLQSSCASIENAADSFARLREAERDKTSLHTPKDDPKALCGDSLECPPPKREIWRYFKTNHTNIARNKRDRTDSKISCLKDASQHNIIPEVRLFEAKERPAGRMFSELNYFDEKFALWDYSSCDSDVLVASNPEEQERIFQGKKHRRKQTREKSRLRPQKYTEREQDEHLFCAASYDKENGTFKGRPVLDYLCDNSKLVAQLQKENQELRNRVFALEMAAAQSQRQIEKDTKHTLE